MEAFSPNHTTWSPCYILTSPPPPQPEYYPPSHVYGSPLATVDYTRKFYNSPPSPHPRPPQLFPATSRPPFASIENIHTPPLRSPNSSRPVKFSTTPVKVEEDVLVMDGILIDSSSPGSRKGIGNARLVKSPLDCGPFESKSPGSGSLAKSPHFSPGTTTNLCNSQFAQGKEDLRPTPGSNFNKPEFALGKEDICRTRHININKPEGQMCRTFTSEGSSTYGTEIRSDHPDPAANEIALNQKLDECTGSSNWLPTDDGIGVRLPFLLADESPSRKAIDACIHGILYDPRRKQRLPVFKEICPE